MNDKPLDVVGIDSSAQIGKHDFVKSSQVNGPTISPAHVAKVERIGFVGPQAPLTYEEQLAIVESMMTCYDTPVMQSAGYVRDLLREIIRLKQCETSPTGALQTELDEMARWCWKHRTNRGQCIVTPDFSMTWGLRRGYTVTLRVKSRTLFYKGFEVLRSHKESLVQALKMARGACQERIKQPEEKQS
jgi:hypothetical protein